MRYSVVFAPEATDQLLTIYDYIAAAASSTVAERYVNGIVPGSRRAADQTARSSGVF
jgi:plasmid stabilization system protein ParE